MKSQGVPISYAARCDRAYMQTTQPVSQTISVVLLPPETERTEHKNVDILLFVQEPIGMQ